MRSSGIWFFIFMLVIVSCSRKPITGSEYLTNDIPRGKVNVIDISDELRFAPGSGELSVGDSITNASPALDKIIDFLQKNEHARAEVKVSHVYRAKRYRQEGRVKSRKLEELFVERGIAPSRLTNKTFLDRRSKYPYNSSFRKVLVVLTNISPM